MSNSKLVYSTDTTLSNLEESVTTKSVRASQQKVRLHLDRKGGGKIVTVVKGMKEPKEKIMRFVYWAKGQLPPSNKRDFDKNWKKVVEQLQVKHPAPTERVYKARLNQK